MWISLSILIHFIILNWTQGVFLVNENDCWWTGCHLKSWTIQGCDEYNRTELCRKDCSNENNEPGYFYYCCGRIPLENSSQSSSNLEGGQSGRDPTMTKSITWSPSNVDIHKRSGANESDCWWTAECQLNTWSIVDCAHYVTHKVEVCKKGCYDDKGLHVGNDFKCCSTIPAVDPDLTKGQLMEHGPWNLVLAVLVTVGILIAIFLAILGICWNKIRQKWKLTALKMLTEQEIDEFLQGNSKRDPHDPHSEIYARPFDNGHEISRDELVLDDNCLLGKGEYGLVMKGFRRRKDENEYVETSELIAIKTVKKEADIMYLKALLSEVKVMAYIGQHDNIVQFIGACTENIRQREILVAFEFCANGDLRHYLQKARPSFKNLFDCRKMNNKEESCDLNLDEKVTSLVSAINMSGKNQSKVKFETFKENKENSDSEFELSTLNLLCFARDIANGMAFLTVKRVIHGDLAARNVLVTEGKTAKICDFGLSRQLFEYSNYVKTQKVPLPFKHMALEALKEMNFSIFSDMWAFGVTLYEIFSLGETPYPTQNWDDHFIEQLTNGYRMGQPQYANEQM